MVKNLPAMQEIWVRPVGGKIPWRKKWQPTAVVLPARSHGQRSLVGYSPRGHKELGMTERVTTQNVKHCFRTLESDLRSKKWRDLTLERRGTALGEIPMSVNPQRAPLGLLRAGQLELTGLRSRRVEFGGQGGWRRRGETLVTEGFCYEGVLDFANVFSSSTDIIMIFLF